MIQLRSIVVIIVVVVIISVSRCKCLNSLLLLNSCQSWREFLCLRTEGLILHSKSMEFTKSLFFNASEFGSGPILLLKNYFLSCSDNLLMVYWMKIFKTTNAATLKEKKNPTFFTLCCLLLFNTRHKGNSRRNVTEKNVRWRGLDDCHVARADPWQAQSRLQ